jgi:ribonuclease HI
MEVNIYTDGGSRGNPGISGYGLVVYDSKDKVIHQQSKFLGIKTNNEAEYAAVLAALEWLKDNKETHKITKINFFSDSQLVVRQIQGKYRVKAPHLKDTFIKCQQLLAQINIEYQFKDIRREFNILADQLANQAMDRH